MSGGIHACFNPRPPLLAGETWANTRPAPARKFQSTPAITGGRDVNTKVGILLRQCFNPRPPLLAGETSQCAAYLLDRGGFNPRPPLLAGETEVVADAVLDVAVSIHARHYWRARRSVARPWARARCFNPRPPLLAGETRAKASCLILALFQSTPAITGGRDFPKRWWHR